MRVFLGLLACCFLSIQGAVIPVLFSREAPFDSVQPPHLDRHHQDEDEKDPTKYFHESSFHQHYDGRFADRQLTYDERRPHLRALVQTYLSTMNDIGAETWIMHGTLLGWWWNRRAMPWDSDVDVMVSEKSIHHLADFYNMTMHHYKLPGIDDGRDYLLEVNPHYTNDSVETSNKIDARWIDTTTGLFIDITTLRRNATAEALGIEGAMMVKDKHHYMYDDIYPLRESTFEDFPAKIPFAYAEVLAEEYTEKALSSIFFEGHRFDPEQADWIPLSCKFFGTCRHWRSSSDRIRLPLSIIEDSEPESATEAPQKPMLGPNLMLDRLGERPLPPRLRDGRPHDFGRWQ